MPHAESEHGLRVELATALRERDEARAQEIYWHNRATEARDEVVRLGDACMAWGARVDEMAADLAAANARADAAEAINKRMAGDFHDESERRDAAEEALAAARRECDLLRAAIDRAVSAFMSGGVCDFCRNNKEKGYHEEDCDLGALIAEAAVAANVARFNTALAAPAPGKET